MGGLTSNDVQGPADLALSRTMTVPDSLEREDPESKLFYHRDPDVNPPETFSEHFFHRLYKIIQWCQTVETTFAFKTAAGFVLLTLPAFLPQSAAWFFAWRGQWATVTLMMWMSPMTGVFFFGYSHLFSLFFFFFLISSFLFLTLTKPTVKDWGD
ncbi:hypothetical protein G6F68_012493 [Rhizopus microsporus]|nr:hypothetical protein G6F68_012493 [Rhizopus microsporus]